MLIEEYLSTSYRPECEFIDGAILERNVGLSDHSGLEGALASYICSREKAADIRTLIAVRVRVSPTRIRVPDVCAVRRTDPPSAIIVRPPVFCAEILAAEDTMESMLDRIDDYLAFGVPYVWVINPRSRRAFIHTTDGCHEARDGLLRMEDPALIVDLSEVFASLE